MNGQFAVFSVQVLYGLLVPICVVAGAHLVFNFFKTKWNQMAEISNYQEINHSLGTCVRTSSAGVVLS